MRWAGPALAAVVLLGMAGCSPVPDSGAPKAAAPTAVVQAAAPAKGFLGGLFSPKNPEADAQGESHKGAVPFVRVKLAGGAVVLSGPTGYCIDPATLQARGGVVLRFWPVAGF
ncbi:hypothetical protein [Puniceibacterium sp. IMCC21224]|uniref:hypothetical protein n=1 Tax=Puniceibacterium sp. IMCC21224 TaxID=1618204 RepID=UPI00065D2A41|nr:hypothetical protein [Puniceibacterium sp. IMCC21224]KMK65821.1 hypothetical protein IMCC21224_11657 [Puniceibacterium sp. IMCC21224]